MIKPLYITFVILCFPLVANAQEVTVGSIYNQQAIKLDNSINEEIEKQIDELQILKGQQETKIIENKEVIEKLYERISKLKEELQDRSCNL